MWRRVPAVASALTAQGGLELIAGLVLMVGGYDWDAGPATTRYGRFLDTVAPGLLVVCGALKSLAASRNRVYRGRTLGLVALWSAVASAAVWACAPSGLALLAWGLVVYRDRFSRHAFALGDAGRTPEEIATALLVVRRIIDLLAERTPGSLGPETRLGAIADGLPQMLIFISKVEAAFEVKLPQDELLLINTIGDLAALVTRTRTPTDSR